MGVGLYAVILIGGALAFFGYQYMQQSQQKALRKSNSLVLQVKKKKSRPLYACKAEHRARKKQHFVFESLQWEI